MFSSLFFFSLAKHRGIHVEKLSVSMLDILENLDKVIKPSFINVSKIKKIISSCVEMYREQGHMVFFLIH